MMSKGILIGLLFATWLSANAVAQEENGPMPPAAGATQPSASPPASPEPRPMRIRVGGNVAAAQIVHQVQPIYPAEAKAAHVSGTVVLHVIIARDGSMQKVEVVSGPPMLIQAAVDAVQQWRYRPTLLNGQPVEVDSTVQVVFTLGSSGDDAQSAAPEAGGDPKVLPLTPKTDDQTIDPQLKADILHLFDVMHLQTRATDMGRAMFQTLRPTLLASLPPTPKRDEIADAYGDRLFALFSSQDFIDRSVALYAKYFSDADVKALADFYQTPAGQHFNDVSGKVASEGVQIGQRLALENLPAILKSLCRDFPELKGAASFCPSEGPERKGLLIAPSGAGQTGN